VVPGFCFSFFDVVERLSPLEKRLEKGSAPVVYLVIGRGGIGGGLLGIGPPGRSLARHE